MPDDVADTIAEARQAYADGRWADATALFLRADGQKPLQIDDLDALAWAAAVSANDQEMLEALERVYAHYTELGDHEQSARAAFWSGLRNMMIGEVGLGAGWLQRAAKHAEHTAPDCAQRGYLLLPQAFANRAKGDYEAAVAIAREAMQFGEKCREFDLVALAGSLLGGLLFRLGRIDEGYVPIDESMLLANGGKLSPVVTGVVYCEVVASCCRVLEMERAREWTEILNAWCKRNPQARAFNGVCQVHRAEVLQLGGNWDEALAEAARAGADLIGTTEQTAMATAAYRRGEILRLRGRFRGADAEYRKAAEIGVDPQPGLSLLRLSEGREEDAAAMVGRALESAGDMPRRAALLPAAIEIAVARSDLDTAQEFCEALAGIAERYGTEVLHRVADHCQGMLALAKGNSGAGLQALDRARRYWTSFGAPYLVARLRVDIARACADLGDAEGARMELDAASDLFMELGAEPDLKRVRALQKAARLSGKGGLTDRERQVLALMAEGGTNRTIADDLGLSPKTVNRHVENIFAKLAVTSRAAAVASALRTGEI